MEYPTEFFDLNVESRMTLQWSVVESLFDSHWLEGPIFLWHRAAMEYKHWSTAQNFVYSVNVQAIPNGLNAVFLDNDRELAWLAAQMRRVDNISIDTPLLIPFYHERHWFLVVLHHIGTLPAIAILDSLRRPGALRYELAARVITRLYPHFIDVAEAPTIPITLVQVPQQPNGFYCGIFVLSFIEKILSATVTVESLFGGNTVSNYWGAANDNCERRREFRAQVAQSVLDGSF